MFDSNSAWIEWLWREQRLSRNKIRHIYQRFPNFEAFRQALFQEKIPPGVELKDSAREQLRQALQKNGVSPNPFPYLSFIDKNYPPFFEHLHDPPVLLYGLGHWQLLQHPRPWIAVVGTRFATAYAMQACEKIIRELAPYNPLILSGMARGIDSKAHWMALEQNMPTIGIVGNSLDKIYPIENSILYKKMSDKALILSEVYPGAEMGKWRFPERNRLLAALADAVIVVEAPVTSGALVTVDFAMELGREVFVVPGPILSPRNQGGHRLIQQGANLLTSADEIFNFHIVKDKKLDDRLKKDSPKNFLKNTVPQKKESSYTGSNSNEKLIWELLKDGPLHIDKIVQISHLAAPSVTAILMEWTLNDIVVELSRGIFELKD